MSTIFPTVKGNEDGRVELSPEHYWALARAAYELVGTEGFIIPKFILDAKASWDKTGACVVIAPREKARRGQLVLPRYEVTNQVGLELALTVFEVLGNAYSMCEERTYPLAEVRHGNVGLKDPQDFALQILTLSPDGRAFCRTCMDVGRTFAFDMIEADGGLSQQEKVREMLDVDKTDVRIELALQSAARLDKK